MVKKLIFGLVLITACYPALSGQVGQSKGFRIMKKYNPAWYYDKGFDEVKERLGQPDHRWTFTDTDDYPATLFYYIIEPKRQEVIAIGFFVSGMERVIGLLHGKMVETWQPRYVVNTVTFLPMKYYGFKK